MRVKNQPESSRGRREKSVFFSKKTLPAQELSFFCTEMGMMLQSGMTIYDGIASRAAQEQSAYRRTDKKAKRPRTLFGRLYQDMQQGCSISEAMQRTGAFPPDFIGMVHIGEESGSLEEVMYALAAHYRRSGEVSAEIRAALTYPVLTLCMMAVILGILTREVFPVFARIYESLGSGLSDAAAASIALGSICADVVAVLAVLLLAAGAGIWLLKRTAWGEKILGTVCGHLPFFRRISRQLSSARAADSLAMMLQAGYDVEESLRKISQSLPDPGAAAGLEKCRKLLTGEKGGRKTSSQDFSQEVSLSDALAESGLWNATECRMIQSGVQLGSLDTVLKYIAEIGMDKAETDVAKAVSLIEPIMIAITAVLIGSILLSVILPLSGIMAAIG